MLQKTKELLSSRKKEEGLLELISYIIDAFEALLDDKGIVLPNIERDQDDGLDPEEAANIFGEDYYRLEDEVNYPAL